DSSWAMFSTSDGTGLYARTGNVSTKIPGSWLGAFHRYRIDWNATNAVYSIDGNVVVTHDVIVSTTMRPVFSDYTLDGRPIGISWLRMTPYTSSGMFLSRVFDAAVSARWGVASWSAAVPVGTALQVSVRLGNTATPDGTWTAFTPLTTSGASISGNSRYLQYRT